jgi:trimeric autotransporter adhesin
MTHTTKVLGGLFLVSLLSLHAADTYPLIATNATWRFRKGLGEASTPDLGAWRTNGFNDTEFTAAAAPFTYGENYAYGTLLNDMINGYGCIFLRQTFEITNLSQVAALRLGAKVDDGFVVWINGSEARRVNMSGQSGDPVFVTTLSTGAPSEPVPCVF